MAKTHFINSFSYHHNTISSLIVIIMLRHHHTRISIYSVARSCVLDVIWCFSVKSRHNFSHKYLKTHSLYTLLLLTESFSV